MAILIRKSAAGRIAIIRAAAVQQRVATVRAFRQLEVDLRAQGIRAVGGAASGGRQRARLREQRRREGIAERLWQRTMGM